MGLTVVGARDRNEESTNDNTVMNETHPERSVDLGERTNTRKEIDGEDLEASYEEFVSFQFDGISQTSVEALNTAIETVLVPINGEFVSDYDKEYFAIAFPDLFPYGRGHRGWVTQALKGISRSRLKIAAGTMLDFINVTFRNIPHVFSLPSMFVEGERWPLQQLFVRASVLESSNR